MPSLQSRPRSQNEALSNFCVLSQSQSNPSGMCVQGGASHPEWGFMNTSGNVVESYPVPELTNPGFVFGGSGEAPLGMAWGDDYYFAAAPPPERYTNTSRDWSSVVQSDLRPHRDHAYTRTDDISMRRQSAYVCQIVSPSDGFRYYACTFTGCRHSVGFCTLQEALVHVRALHVPDKPFICTTCGASFMRKQDAARHVNTMNSGKKYKCCVCKEAYSRKDYCLVHEKRCLATRRGAVSA